MRRFFLLIVLAATICSCVRPSSTETFIPVDGADFGMYRYELDLTDSLATYDLSFYTRVDGAVPGMLCLDVTWTSPVGDTFGETVYMHTGDSNGACEAYRTGVSPRMAGIWKLDVNIPDAPEGLRGLGLVCKRNGTR